MDVGVRELKAHLSDYLDRAANGELIRVTDRGVPKAILGPLSADSDRAIEKGIAEGWIRPGSGAAPREFRRFRSEIRSEDVIAEDRGYR